jgi:hypothetical protein
MVGQGKMPSTEAVKLAVGGTLNVERLSTDPITWKQIKYCTTVLVSDYG